MKITAPMVSRMEFAHNFHWDVSFPTYSRDFFPASVMSDESFSFENGDIQHGPGNFNFPQKSGRGELTFQIFETGNWDLYEWLKAWQAKIFDMERYTVGLLGHKGVVERMEYYLHDGLKTPKVSNYLLVIPQGSITYELGSDKAAPVSVNLTLTPVGSLVEG